jgi:hypothetical protein
VKVIITVVSLFLLIAWPAVLWLGLLTMIHYPVFAMILVAIGLIALSVIV